MNTHILKTDLEHIEKSVSEYFSTLLQVKEKFILFAVEDLEHDEPDVYLEYRNDITGEVIDVHPLKVDDKGILILEANGSGEVYHIKFSDLCSTQDKITLCELMEEELLPNN